MFSGWSVRGGCQVSIRVQNRPGGEKSFAYNPPGSALSPKPLDQAVLSLHERRGRPGIPSLDLDTMRDIIVVCLASEAAQVMGRNTADVKLSTPVIVRPTRPSSRTRHSYPDARISAIK